MTTASSLDLLTTWVLLDPCNPPQEIMVQWNDGSWLHRAYWGPDRLGCGADSPACHTMGALPPVGQWVRLDVPAGSVNLRARTISGMAFDVYGGKAWFDRPGTVACTVPVATPPSSFPPTDVVWFDDATPTGAALTGTWIWDTSQKASGTQSVTSNVSSANQEWYFTGATTTMTTGSSADVLTAWVLLDPCDPPKEIMLQWNDGSWLHRAYWGPDLIGCGADSPACHRIGALPSIGQWVRLEVPAGSVNLSSSTISGMAFDVYGGKARFDRIAKTPAGSGAMKPPGPMIASMTPPSRWRRLIHRLRRGEDTSLGFSVTTKLTTATGPTRSYSFYTPELQLLAETALTDAATPSIAYDYVWFGGEPLVQVNTTTGEIAYDFNDHLGAPLLQTATAGALVWRAEREPYGNRYLVRTGGDRHQPLGLPGQEHSESAPLQYNIHRWYRSGWGRYIESDAVESSQPYDYSFDNPIRYVDPLGLFPIVGCRPRAAALIHETVREVLRDTKSCLGCDLPGYNRIRDALLTKPIRCQVLPPGVAGQSDNYETIDISNELIRRALNGYGAHQRIPLPPHDVLSPCLTATIFHSHQHCG
jgi:RHS repeat-associated protein